MHENDPHQLIRTRHLLLPGKLGEAPAVVKDSLPEPEPEGAAALPDEEEVSDMQARLEALRS